MGHIQFLGALSRYAGGTLTRRPRPVMSCRVAFALCGAIAGSPAPHQNEGSALRCDGGTLTRLPRPTTSATVCWESFPLCWLHTHASALLRPCVRGALRAILTASSRPCLYAERKALSRYASGTLTCPFSPIPVGGGALRAMLEARSRVCLRVAPGPHWNGEHFRAMPAASSRPASPRISVLGALQVMLVASSRVCLAPICSPRHG
jgi:hypothetical protein